MKPARPNEGKTRFTKPSDEIKKRERASATNARRRTSSHSAVEADAERGAPSRRVKKVEDVESRVRAQQMILDNIVDGVVVSDRDGKILYSNPAAETLLKATIDSVSPDGWSDRYGFYRTDEQTPFPPDELPVARALQGEVVVAQEIFFRHSTNPAGGWLVVSARPVMANDGSFFGAVGVFRDISERKRWEKQLEQQLAREKERNDALERLRLTVQQLSTPILEIWDEVLVLPIIGVLDTRRSGEMTDQLLEEITRKQCRFVIVDVTGVEIVDSSTADQLLRLVSAVELLGARCMLTGVRPAVAQTLTTLRVDLGPMLTLRNLKHGLQTCLRLMQTETDVTRAMASRQGGAARR
ncbi:hypothetical protein BE17_43520 [Sorangium cellulosum]|uniref:Anti-anti-sigma factor n=1 Tax=Sorangium cellulosum TaxID=56 RepID=A0A150RSR2_SORCE|nr:hypothetical protein BE17_43520 [Sorangium cellulosum]